MKTTTNKIGKGYFQSGQGRGFKKGPVIRLIDGKAYAKGSTALPFETDKKGYVMVDVIHYNGVANFFECGLISEHQAYK